MSGEDQHIEKGQPSPTRMERVGRVFEGLVWVVEIKVVEDRPESSNLKPMDEQTTIVKFYKQNLVSFYREVDTKKADFWIIDKEHIFYNLPCTNEQKILFATNTF